MLILKATCCNFNKQAFFTLKHPAYDKATPQKYYLRLKDIGLPVLTSFRSRSNIP